MAIGAAFLVVLILLGLVFGGGTVWLFMRGRRELAFEQGRASVQAELIEKEAAVSNLSQQLEQLRQEFNEVRRQLDQTRESRLEAKEQVARLETQLNAERRQNEEKLNLLTEAKAQLTHEFQHLAGKILEEKSQKFTDQNRDNLSQILNPLKEQLGDFRRKVEDVYEKESKDRVSLFHEIKHLKDLNQKISEDALNLTNALKGQTKTQGAWGEVILERVLEESGLHNGREYETQGSFVNEAGQRQRPDVIVHLPEGKDIIIDSKVSLTAYERYCSSEDDQLRQAALKEHIASLQEHMKGLSRKNYDDLPGVRSLDFVLMFVPIEAAFITAVEHDRQLFSQAFEKNIMVVSPSTLLATLRTIHNIWRYEYQNKNAQAIADSAGKLHDQFVAFVEALEDVGDKLDKAQKAYETAHKRLTSGRGNLVNRTQSLQKLGARTKKQLGERLLEQGEEETDSVS